MTRDDEPTTYGILLRAATQQLTAAGVEVPQRQAAWLLEEATGLRAAALYARPNAPVERAAAAQFWAMVKRRLQGEPLQYVVGHAEFYGLRLRVTPDVLIPRPETEQVVEEALSLIEPLSAPRVLDAGTGSGCIALALKYVRSDAHIFACDICSEVLNIACDNAAHLGLAVSFAQADLLSENAHRRLPGALDLLVSNPPYIPDAEAGSLPPDVRDHEPAAALFSGTDPLRFYRALVRCAARMLAPGGHIVLETHADYAGGVEAVLREAGLAEVRTKRDLAGQPRIATARRSAT